MSQLLLKQGNDVFTRQLYADGLLDRAPRGADRIVGYAFALRPLA